MLLAQHTTETQQHNKQRHHRQQRNIRRTDNNERSRVSSNAICAHVINCLCEQGGTDASRGSTAATPQNDDRVRESKSVFAGRACAPLFAGRGGEPPVPYDVGRSSCCFVAVVSRSIVDAVVSRSIVDAGASCCVVVMLLFLLVDLSPWKQNACSQVAPAPPSSPEVGVSHQQQEEQRTKRRE